MPWGVAHALGCATAGDGLHDTGSHGGLHAEPPRDCQGRPPCLLPAGLGLPRAVKLQPHFGSSLSLHESLTGVEGKTVLRHEAKRRGLAVWNRPKHPFAAPFLAWFGAEHRAHWEPEILRPGGVERYLDPDRLKQWFDQGDGVNNAFKVWQLYTLARFLELEDL